MFSKAIRVIKYVFLYFVARVFFFKKYENTWIICERKNEARDNGYHLYKYIRENYTKIPIYYLIDKKCNDAKRITNYGNIIDFGSLKHYILYFTAKNHISTHIDGCVPDYEVNLKLKKYFFPKAKRVFLQHGIIKDYLKGAVYNNAMIDLFVCGAKQEYEYIKRNFGYRDQVKYLGLCRFDNLTNISTKKQILVMPTFRSWLFPYNEKGLSKDREKIFLESLFYKKYQDLLNDNRIIDFLEEYNYVLILFNHYELQKYNSYFFSKSKNVIIADKESYDIQELLKSSKLLVTDYSSVYFDFAYMKKPILYYQFDYLEYREKHYSEGYFSYKDHGFGKIVLNEEDLVNEILELSMRQFKIEDFYKKRSEEFFELHDNLNCERNLQAILDLDKDELYNAN